jgi:NAD(P)H dehydrogenase (quinone)
MKMSDSGRRLGVTGASGKLGGLVISQLLERAAPSDIITLTRGTASQAELRGAGIDARIADYTRPDSLIEGLTGVERLLLISAAEPGQRTAQQRNVIEASVRAGVREIIYTIMLHADSSPIDLAGEHRETEALLAKSGVAFVLRNGWYTENGRNAAPEALGNHKRPSASGNEKERALADGDARRRLDRPNAGGREPKSAVARRQRLV